MRRLSQKILRVLDGSPGALGGYQRGQSLVELLLITPLLIIMVAGIIEIGWYANHVLILLEVTRVGARQATLFTGEYGYQAWDESATIHPIAYKLTNGFTATTDKPTMGTFGGTTGALYAVGAPPGTPPIAAANYRNCDILGQNRGFYNSVVCSMMSALDPLSLKGRAPSTSDILAKRIRVNYSYPTLKGREYPGGRIAYTYDYSELFLYPDDIVVSVFALQAINNATATQKQALVSDPNTYARTADFGNRFPRGYQVVVVGRYPKAANECNVVYTPLPINQVANPTPDKLGPNELYLQHLLTMGAAGSDYVSRYWDTPVLPLYLGREAINAPQPVGGTFSFMQYDVADPTTWIFRDPFEYYGTASPPSQVKRDSDAAAARYFELEGYDTTPEFQRGFVWTGQHIVNGILDQATGRQLFCIGSEWSDQRVQDTMNSPQFLKKGVVMPPNGDPNDTSAAGVTWRSDPNNMIEYNKWQERAKFLPSQGAVLVELFWRHDVLLDFPLMRPVIRLMEGAGGPYNIVISVWAVFPLPSAEPNLNFGFPPKP